MQRVPSSDLRLDFEKMGGLIPVVVQDYQSRDVLMVGFMNDAAWATTQSTGLVTFYSRQRQKLWTKGETSGNVLRVRHVLVDCDEDSLVIEVEPHGPTCHTGERSCFFREVGGA